MKILTGRQIREVDKYTIEHEPITSTDLMERASLACSTWIVEKYPKDKPVKVFIGPGNNGGDGLCVAYFLLLAGYRVTVFMPYTPDSISPDAIQKYNRLQSYNREVIVPLMEPYKPEINEKDLVIDALFGTGLTRPLTGYPSLLINLLNKSGAEVVAIDIPSGLFTESNDENRQEAIIRASYTLTFQMPKLAFMFAENYAFTGDFTVLDIGLHPEGLELQESRYLFQQSGDLKEYLKKRKKFDHKGVFGHALLLSGSYGKMGAAVLSSKACLRTGVGLLTTHIPKIGYEIMQTAVPEAMISPDINSEFMSVAPDIDNYSAIGAGPGIGTTTQATEVLRDILTKSKVPIVLDADALNILAQNQWLLCMIPPKTILTPHPKEFDRIVGEHTNGYERFFSQIEFSRKFNVIIVLKGAYTSITNPKGECWFNSTGNPGMATAGSGDVLTGVILSLLAQGYEPEVAARLGVYLHGMAGDIALTKNSFESIIASDIINYIGTAFNTIRN